MKLRTVAKSLGALSLLLATFGTLPLAAALAHHEQSWPWLVMIAVGAVAGTALLIVGRRSKPQDLGIREGVAVTVFAWLGASLIAGIGIDLAVSAVPAPQGYAAGDRCSYAMGWFEAMSGLTTTGSSVFGDSWTTLADGTRLHTGALVAELPVSVKLWRGLLQLFGGIGIVVVSLALLPLLVGGSGFLLYRSEVTGLHADRLAPRIADTARILLGLYVGVWLALVVSLLGCGVSALDAVVHASAAISTGGFANYDTSAEGLNSAAAEWVLVVGMIIGGLNSGLVFTAIRGRPQRLLRSGETRSFLLVLLLGSALVGWSLWRGMPGYAGRYHDLVRDSVFQVVTVATTTGFATGFDVAPAGWDAWPPLARTALVFMMLGLGCAGSTAGGVKMVRVLVAMKAARRELRRFVEPNRVTPIQLDGSNIPDVMVIQVSAFLIVYGATWAVGSLVLAALDLPMDVACSASLTFVGNNGPGVGSIGPAGNFRDIGTAGHVVGALLMLIGRLELFGVLMMMNPRQWRR